MTEEEFNLKREKICEFRYSVVAELGNPYLGRGQLTQLIKEKSNREYDIPYSSRKSLTEGCIRRWFSLYRKYEREGLNPNIRMDSGKSRIIGDKEQTAIISLLESNPKLTATAAVKKLIQQDVIKRDISSSSLSRFIKSNGLSVKNRQVKSDEEKNLKFNFFYPMECVQSDVMYGPKLSDDNGKI